ncbi:basic proline-rich protein-like [Meriones unguiculatus]|uniref:basic proline-rich protein-like n=1 Tax=Meriones unguiculatus TaxID=10047 RepID=UPI00293EA0A0|nr:basic proline-rich protein-like [Meriones unguiculatus]
MAATSCLSPNPCLPTAPLGPAHPEPALPTAQFCLSPGPCLSTAPLCPPPRPALPQRSSPWHWQRAAVATLRYRLSPAEPARRRLGLGAPGRPEPACAHSRALLSTDRLGRPGRVPAGAARRPPSARPASRGKPGRGERGARGERLGEPRAARAPPCPLHACPGAGAPRDRARLPSAPAASGRGATRLAGSGPRTRLRRRGSPARPGCPAEPAHSPPARGEAPGWRPTCGSGRDAGGRASLSGDARLWRCCCFQSPSALSPPNRKLHFLSVSGARRPSHTPRGGSHTVPSGGRGVAGRERPSHERQGQGALAHGLRARPPRVCPWASGHVWRAAGEPRSALRPGRARGERSRPRGQVSGLPGPARPRRAPRDLRPEIACCGDAGEVGERPGRRRLGGGVPAFRPRGSPTGGVSAAGEAGSGSARGHCPPPPGSALPRAAPPPRPRTHALAPLVRGQRPSRRGWCHTRRGRRRAGTAAPWPVTGRRVHAACGAVCPPRSGSAFPAGGRGDSTVPAVGASESVHPPPTPPPCSPTGKIKNWKLQTRRG